MKKYVTYGPSGFYPGVDPINYADEIMFDERIKDPERLAIMQGRDIGKGMQAYEDSFRPGNIPSAMMSPNPSTYAGPQSIKKMPSPITTQTQPSYSHMMGPLHGAPSPASVMPANQMGPTQIRSKQEVEPRKDKRSSDTTTTPSVVPGGKQNSVAEKVSKSFLQKIGDMPLSPGKVVDPSMVGVVPTPTVSSMFNPMNYINPVIEGGKMVGQGLTGGGLGMIGSGLSTMFPPLLFGGIIGKALGLFNRGTHNVRPAQDENIRLGLTGPLSTQGYAFGTNNVSALVNQGNKTDEGRKQEKHDLNQFLTAAKGLQEIQKNSLGGGPLQVS